MPKPNEDTINKIKMQTNIFGEHRHKTFQQMLASKNIIHDDQVRFILEMQDGSTFVNQ